MTPTRLETLGRHSLSLLHDLNNLVTRMNFHVELANMQPQSNHLAQAAAVAKQASELCRGMTLYVRCQAVALQVLDLAAFLREYVTRNERQGGGELVLAIDRPLESALVAFNPFALQQLLENLVTNAYAAGARLVIIRLRIPSDTPAEIDIEDTGPGLPETVLSKLGSPFNTHKPTGTGLGIFLASEIMRDHGGAMTARNKAAGQGSGAIFTLKFPHASKAEQMELAGCYPS